MPLKYCQELTCVHGITMRGSYVSVSWCYLIVENDLSAVAVVAGTVKNNRISLCISLNMILLVEHLLSVSQIDSILVTSLIFVVALIRLFSILNWTFNCCKSRSTPPWLCKIWSILAWTVWPLADDISTSSTLIRWSESLWLNLLRISPISISTVYCCL